MGASSAGEAMAALETSRSRVERTRRMDIGACILMFGFYSELKHY